MKKIIIGSDHGGFELKQYIKNYILGFNFSVDDLGTFSSESIDYPDIAFCVANKVIKEKIKGILICGTGIGMSIAANKIKGIRAALCHDEYTAKMSREHNDANILCLGGRILKVQEAEKIVDIWLKTSFSGEPRHKKRLTKISEYEKCLN